MPRSQTPGVKILTARLPEALYRKLDQAGEGKGGISAVVRDVLERGLQAEAPAIGDETTAWGLKFAAWAAHAINVNYGKQWHQTSFLTRVYALAVGIYLAHYLPGEQPGKDRRRVKIEEEGEVEAGEMPRPGSPLAFVLGMHLRDRDPLDPEAAANALLTMWVIREYDDVQAVYGIPVPKSD